MPRPASEIIGLELPPLPRLTWHEHGWRGTCQLAGWTGDAIQLVVAHADDGPHTLPARWQRDGFQQLLDHGAALAALVRSALFAEYLTARAAFHARLIAAQQPVPTVTSPADLAALVTLDAVHVLVEQRDGLAYVGFQLRCPWEPELGAGVLVHDRRVVASGDGDVAFDVELAADDASDVDDAEADVDA